MKITEFRMIVKFNKDIELPKHHYYLGKLIAKTIYHENSDIKEDHYKHKFKPYVYSKLPKEKIYKKGKEYNFILRTIDESIKKNILKEYNDEFGKIKVINQKEINLENELINYMLTASPVILVKKNKKYFNPEKDSIKEAVDMINRNAAKKINQFLNMNVDPDTFDFIEAIKIRNSYPIVMKYKDNVKMIGNHFIIIPKDDDISQKAAKLLTGIGIGHKNASMGAGFTGIGI